MSTLSLDMSLRPAPKASSTLRRAPTIPTIIRLMEEEEEKNEEEE